MAEPQPYVSFERKDGTPRAVERFCASGRAEVVETLVLADSSLGNDALAVLCGSSRWTALTSLDLSGNPFGAPGALALSRAPFLSQLRSLTLGKHNIPDEALCTLLVAPTLTSLTELRIESATPSVIAALASSAWIGIATRLDLPYGHALSGAALEPLCSVPSVGREAALNFYGGGVDDDGARSLARWPGLRSVAELSLNHNDLGIAGVRALAASPYRESLRSLGLDGNPRIVRDIEHLDWDGSRAHASANPDDIATLAAMFPGVAIR